MLVAVAARVYAPHLICSELTCELAAQHSPHNKNLPPPPSPRVARQRHHRPPREGHVGPAPPGRRRSGTGAGHDEHLAGPHEAVRPVVLTQSLLDLAPGVGASALVERQAGGSLTKDIVNLPVGRKLRLVACKSVKTPTSVHWYEVTGRKTLDLNNLVKGVGVVGDI